MRYLLTVRGATVISCAGGFRVRHLHAWSAEAQTSPSLPSMPPPHGSSNLIVAPPQQQQADDELSAFFELSAAPMPQPPPQQPTANSGEPTIQQGDDDGPVIGPQLPPGLQQQQQQQQGTPSRAVRLSEVLAMPAVRLSPARHVFDDHQIRTFRYRRPTPQELERVDTCAICAENLSTGEDMIILKCRHVYHFLPCVARMLKLAADCPICRAPIHYTYGHYHPYF